MLENNYKTAKSVFPIVWLYIMAVTKNLERNTKQYYQHYQKAGLTKKKFHGVKLSELNELEKLF